jgi:hypothetical protein
VVHSTHRHRPALGEDAPGAALRISRRRAPFAYREGDGDGKLDGKVALISGGAKGQGAAEARTFAREGAKVVFGDILDAEGKKVEEAIRAEAARPRTCTST